MVGFCDGAQLVPGAASRPVFGTEHGAAGKLSMERLRRWAHLAGSFCAPQLNANRRHQKFLYVSGQCRQVPGIQYTERQNVLSRHSDS